MTDQSLNDLDQSLQLVNTRVSTNVQAIDSFSTHLKQLKEDINNKLGQFSQQQLQEFNTTLDKKISSVQLDASKMKQVISASEEAVKGMDHLKQSMDALWSSIGVLSGRIVDVEANLDRIK